METYHSRFAHGLMFHRFRKSQSPSAGQGSVTDIEFEKIINHIGPERFLSPEEWIERVKRNSLNKNHLCITFDDGLRSQFDVALPILEKYNLKAFWFVFSSVFEGYIDRNEVYNRFASTEFSSFNFFVEEFLRFFKANEKMFKSIDFDHFSKSIKAQVPFYTENDLKYRYIRNKILPKNEFEEVLDNLIESKGLSISNIAKDLWLTNDHLLELYKNGHYIGLHSYDHPFEMANLDRDEQKNQFLRNYQHISHIIDNRIECMSHPLNSYSQDTIEILCELGIVCGFRSNMNPPPGKVINAHCLELAREDSQVFI